MIPSIIEEVSTSSQNSVTQWHARAVPYAVYRAYNCIKQRKFHPRLSGLELADQEELILKTLQELLKDKRAQVDGEAVSLFQITRFIFECMVTGART